MMRVPDKSAGGDRPRLAVVATALALAGVVAAGSTPAPASAQIRVGPQLSYVSEVFGGAIGVGPRVEFGIPAFPVRLAASGDYFFPDCNQCRYWEGNVNLLVSLPIMPIPFLRYLGGGWHLQSVRANAAEGAIRARGFNAVGGLGSGNTNIEFRYEFVEDIADQYVVSFAILFL